jgi:hypothetical protein
VLLSARTKPLTIEIDLVSRYRHLFELLVQSAAKVIIHELRLHFVDENVPMRLPALKMLIIDYIGPAKHPQNHFRFFAPQLEELWVGETKMSADALPRDENGVFTVAG